MDILVKIITILLDQVFKPLCYVGILIVPVVMIIQNITYKVFKVSPGK